MAHFAAAASDASEPYKTRLCDTFGQCQNGTKTMTQKLPLCAKSWHSFMTI